MTRADTSVEIHDLIAERRSPRSLDETATIEDQDLLAMLEAARWAPSSNNLQPWKFIAGKRDDSNFTALLECLVPLTKAGQSVQLPLLQLLGLQRKQMELQYQHLCMTAG